nr:copia protein [Tanacetum cinerariifolium]
MINVKVVYLTEQEIQEYWDKEDKMKKAVEETKLLVMSRPEVIKVIREEAKKLGINLKEAISTKAGETFKKAQDAEHEVLKREHSKKDKRLIELNRRRAKEYMWTMTNIIKPEPITNVRIHPNTKPIIAFVFRNNDKRNFNVHNPFKLTDFGITKFDELGPIIQKKKNFVVKDLMISLIKRYERLKKILEELRI